MGYISKEGEDSIKAFKYQGGNLSISYNHLWSPIAELMLKVTPSSMAPNTLTVFGFFLHTVATIILCLQAPFGQAAATWSLWLYGFCVFWYQMLDNLDGKQARKLQNSTPLGMIMDHGCDALGVICLTSGMTRVVCMDDADLYLWVLVAVTFSFYISAWCQYWSKGVLILGEVNGVDDGIPIIWATAFFTAVFGQQMFHIPISLLGYTFPLNKVIGFIIMFSTIIQIHSVMNQGSEFTKQVGRALLDLTHFAMMAITMLSITNLSDFAQEYVVGIAIGFAFAIARSVSYTLLCSTAKMQFQQFTPSVLVFTFSYLAYILFFRSLFSPAFVVYGVAVFAIVQYFVFVVSFCNQIARILEIPIFSVFKPKQARN